MSIYFSTLTMADLANIQHKINRRPGKLLNFENPECVCFDTINKSAASAP